MQAMGISHARKADREPMHVQKTQWKYIEILSNMILLSQRNPIEKPSDFTLALISTMMFSVLQFISIPLGTYTQFIKGLKVHDLSVLFSFNKPRVIIDQNSPRKQYLVWPFVDYRISTDCLPVQNIHHVRWVSYHEDNRGQKHNGDTIQRMRPKTCPWHR